jgi:hypothetical protein
MEDLPIVGCHPPPTITPITATSRSHTSTTITTTTTLLHSSGMASRVDRRLHHHPGPPRLLATTLHETEASTTIRTRFTFCGRSARASSDVPTCCLVSGRIPSVPSTLVPMAILSSTKTSR